MNNFWSLLGISFGAIAPLTAGAVWLVKILSNQLLERDLERFKAELGKENKKFEIQYSNLYQERAQVIKEVYKKIEISSRALSDLVSPLQYDVSEDAESKRHKKAAESINDLSEYFYQNEIFFEKELAEKISKLIKEFIAIWHDFQIVKSGKPVNTEDWGTAWERVRDKIPNITAPIAADFRKIIGIEEKNEKK